MVRPVTAASPTAAGGSFATFIAGARTLIWIPLFFIGSLLICLLALASLFVSDDWLRITPRWWACWQRWCNRIILRQYVVVEGAMPTDPALVVMKHEAMFETIDLMLLLNRPVAFAKAELFGIPLWGTLARHYGLIAIDRAAGAAALRHMLGEAQAARAEGRPLVLFPEGTRVAPGDAPDIRAGFAGLYKLLGLDVVPVAVASGHLGGRPGWIRWPGTVHYRIGAVIPAGLPRNEAETRVHAAINSLNSAERIKDSVNQ
jgi:1-acyl-sn-glycerol-3-phosphate acyltransferase